MNPVSVPLQDLFLLILPHVLLDCTGLPPHSLPAQVFDLFTQSLMQEEEKSKEQQKKQESKDKNASAPPPTPAPAPTPAAAVPAPAPVAAKPAEWMCGVCTFLNKPARYECEICLSPNPEMSKPSPAPVAPPAPVPRQASIKPAEAKKDKEDENKK